METFEELENFENFPKRSENFEYKLSRTTENWNCKIFYLRKFLLIRQKKLIILKTGDIPNRDPCNLTFLSISIWLLTFFALLIESVEGSTIVPYSLNTLYFLSRTFLLLLILTFLVYLNRYGGWEWCDVNCFHPSFGIVNSICRKLLIFAISIVEMIPWFRYFHQ